MAGLLIEFGLFLDKGIQLIVDFIKVAGLVLVVLGDLMADIIDLRIYMLVLIPLKEEILNLFAANVDIKIGQPRCLLAKIVIALIIVAGGSLGELLKIEDVELLDLNEKVFSLFQNFSEFA